MTLILVRHGESEGNAARIIQGGLDTALTELGRAQAEAAARRLASIGAVRLYASPLLRAWQTAERIAASTALVAEPVPGLREYGYGEAQGLTWNEALARFGRQRMRWGSGEVPGEEGGEAFHARVTATVTELLAAHTDDLAIAVAHGGVIQEFLASVFGVPRGEFAPLSVQNAALTILQLERGEPVLVTLNEACHLVDVPATAPPPV